MARTRQEQPRKKIKTFFFWFLLHLHTTSEKINSRFFSTKKNIDCLFFFYWQVELTGNSIFEYIHNYDQDEMNAILSLHPHMHQNLVSSNELLQYFLFSSFEIFAFPLSLSSLLSLNFLILLQQNSHRMPLSILCI